MQQAIPPDIQTDAPFSFEALFKANFKGLHAYATTIIRDDAAAEDIVQNTFLKLWKIVQEGQLPDSPVAYLYRAVYNESLNLLKHQKVKAAYQQYKIRDTVNDAAPATGSHRELEARLDTALKALLEQCRTIFQLSRFEELKYREIAGRLGLSVKTIEAQMGKALRILRTQLTDYLPAPLMLLLLAAGALFYNDYNPLLMP